METNITINNKKYYRITATIGKDSDGKAIRKQFYGNNRREAELKKKVFVLNNKMGRGNIRLSSAFTDWYQFVLSPSISCSTKIRYEQEYRLRLKKSKIMDININEVRSIHIQGFYNELLQNMATVNSIKIIHSMLSGFFKFCHKTDVITKNPLKAVQLPKSVPVKDKKPKLTEKDMRKLIKHSKNNMDTFIFVFAMFTGLRQGELVALTYKDLESEMMTVSKTVGYLPFEGKYKYVVSSAKTKKSVRQVPLLKKLIPLLAKHIKAERDKHAKLAVPFTGDSPVFSSANCGYMNGRNLRRKLSATYKKLNIEPTTFHGLRHTFCSMLSKNGVNLKTASELMGHSNINTTLRIYTHIQEDEKIQGISTLAKLFPK